MERRTRWGSHHFYLFFDVDRNTNKISIETSWLPDEPDVHHALSPLGFRRRDDGSHRVTLSDSDDEVGILRRATKALTILLKEATLKL